MIVQKIFYQFLRFKKTSTIRFINGFFLKLLVLTQVSMGVIITSVRPIGECVSDNTFVYVSPLRICMFCPFHSCCLPAPTVLAPAKATRGGWCQTQTATNQDQKGAEPPSHKPIRRRRSKKGRSKKRGGQGQMLREVRGQIKDENQRTVSKRWQDRAGDRFGGGGDGSSEVT